MKVVYASVACSEDYFSKLSESSIIIPGQQVQKFNRLMIEGFAENQINITTISAPPISRTVSKKLFFKSESSKLKNLTYNHLPVINLPVLRHFLTFIFSFSKCFSEVVSNEETLVICDALNISVSLGAVFATKIFPNRSCSIGIVTDLPSDLSSKNDLLIRLYHFTINLFNGYVFLTEAMNDRLNISNKRYTVVEGLVDIKMKNVNNSINNKTNKNILMYAGGIYQKYGISKLVESFINCNLPNTELHIYGDGDYKDTLLEVSKQNSAVKYFGVIENREVVSKEIQADVLINPRPSDDEYTKFSFPSKNLEYMASGTPILTTKLPGMPIEYYDYVYMIEDETIFGFSECLNTIFSKEKQELIDFGNCAKDFVIKYKSNLVQASRVLDVALKIKRGQ